MTLDDLIFSVNRLHYKGDEGEAVKQPEMKAILQDHHLWLQSDGKQGKRVNLHGASLVGASLQGADLEYANLRCVNLEGANLPHAKFTTNFKKVRWFDYAIFSEDQIPWVVLHPSYPKWAHTLRWVKAKADAA